jgi:hypothetical protein
VQLAYHTAFAANGVVMTTGARDAAPCWPLGDRINTFLQTHGAANDQLGKVRPIPIIGASAIAFHLL